MAIQKRGILKNYFKTGCYPTEQQFSHVLDSFVHKNDKIGIGDVEGLSDILDSKAEKAVTDLKDYAETGKVLPLNGVYVYYGMPVHSRALEALDTDFDPEAQEGDTTQVLVFCCAHMDGDNSGKGSIYLVYQNTNSGYAYYVRFTNQDVPEDILRAFGEATATSTADGLMGKEDKLKLDEIREIDITNYIGTDKVLPQGKGCVYYYSDMGVTPIGVERYILPTDRSGNIVDDESSQDNGLFYVVRLHRQFVPQERWAIVVWKNDGTYYGEYEYQSAPAALLRAMYGIQYIPIENYVRDTNSQLPLRREYIHTFGGKRIILDYICLSVSGNKIVMPPPEDGGIYAMDSAYFWVYYHSRGEDLPDGNSPFYVWRASGHYYGELTDTEIAALELAYHESLATRTHHGMMSAPDKIKLDAVNVLDINNFCRTGGKLPQGWENRNFFTKNGLPVEMRQWDNNSQKYMVFATLSLGDVEEKALGTAPMEYRNSYYVFIDDDNGQYEYLTTYGYSTVPIEIARAFHGEERSEAVTDIFSL